MTVITTNPLDDLVCDFIDDFVSKNSQSSHSLKGNIAYAVSQWRPFIIFKERYFLKSFLFLKINSTKQKLVSNYTVSVFLVLLIYKLKVNTMVTNHVAYPWFIYSKKSYLLKLFCQTSGPVGIFIQDFFNLNKRVLILVLTLEPQVLLSCITQLIFAINLSILPNVRALLNLIF